jgi:hypothetical protein
MARNLMSYQISVKTVGRAETYKWPDLQDLGEVADLFRRLRASLPDRATIEYVMVVPLWYLRSGEDSDYKPRHARTD